MFGSDVPERALPFDVVCIEVFRLASAEETALAADGTITQALELIPDEFKPFLHSRGIYVRCRCHNMQIMRKFMKQYL